MNPPEARKPPRPKPMVRQQALQLLELLVVMAVVVIPAIVLLLTAVQAREQARILRCASNLRRIHLALLSYVEQNDGALPIPAYSWDPQSPEGRWAIQIDGVGRYSWTMGTLWQALPGMPAERARLFMCPADPCQIPAESGSGASSFPRNFSYNLNVWMRGPNPQNWQTPPGLTGTRLGQIVCPAEKILIAEEQDPHDGCFDGYWPLAWRHLQKGNQCFADGHVELFDPTPFAALAAFDNDSPTVVKYVRLRSSP